METSKIGQRAPPPPAAQVRAPAVPEGDEADAPAILTEMQDPAPPDAAPSWPQQVYTGEMEWYTPGRSWPSSVRSWGRLRSIRPRVTRHKPGCRPALLHPGNYGLRQPWPGTVYLNPPYKLPDVARFIGKLCEELDAQRTTAAILAQI